MKRAPRHHSTYRANRRNYVLIAVEMPRQTKRPPMFPSYDLGFPRGVP